MASEAKVARDILFVAASRICLDMGFLIRAVLILEVEVLEGERSLLCRVHSLLLFVYCGKKVSQGAEF